MENTPKVRTCLWLAERGIDAAELYVSLLPDSRIESTKEYGQPDDPMVVEFMLAGAPMMILTAGPHFKLSPAASISVLTDDQAETDRLWTALTSDGGEESRCGWLTDRFGVSWQIVPKRLLELQSDTNTNVATQVRDAMLQMAKIDIATLEDAANAARTPI